jgi:cell division protease FtsH
MRTYRPAAVRPLIASGAVMTLTDNTRFNVGYAIAAIFAIFLIQHMVSTISQIAVIPYSEYQQLLKQGKVESVGISDRQL